MRLKILAVLSLSYFGFGTIHAQNKSFNTMPSVSDETNWSNPTEGDIIFNTGDSDFYGYVGGTSPDDWKKLSVERNKWQMKKLLNDISSDTDSNFSDISFTGLSVGKTYRITAHVFFSPTGANDLLEVKWENDGAAVFSMRVQSADVENHFKSGSILFEADGTTLDAKGFSLGTNTVRGNNSISETWVILEELPSHTEGTFSGSK